MKNYSAKCKILQFLIVILIFVFWVLPFKAAEAALIIQAPKYIGLNSGLVGYWSFDGKDMAGNTAYDRSGQGNNGTLTNGPTRTIGKIGQGLSFDGSNDYVAAARPTALTISSPYTISMWVKEISGGGALKGFLSIEDAASNQITTAYFYSTTNGILVSRATNPPTHTNSQPASVVTITNWNHLIITGDGSSARPTLYINGVLNDASSAAWLGGWATNSIHIGRGLDTSYYANAAIDDVRVYNRVLSGDEIKRLYRIGATLKINTDVSRDNPDLERGLVGLWSFDGKDMAGNTAYDRSGQGNNGTLTNGPTRTIGKIGQGLSFDGVDDYVNAGRNPSLDMGANNFSVGGWIKTSGNPSAQAGNPGYGLLAAKGSSGAGGKRYGLWAYRQTTGVAALNLDDNAAEAYFEGTTNVDDGNWHMVYGVRDGNTAKIYVDGIQENTADITGLGSLDDINKDFMISVDSHAPTNYFVRGLIDDVRIYNRALTPAEIQRLYNLGR